MGQSKTIIEWLLIILTSDRKLQTAENIGSSSGDIRKGFLVGGFSAGGTAAALMAVKARDDPFFKDKPLTGQFLNAPHVVHADGIPEK